MIHLTEKEIMVNWPEHYDAPAVTISCMAYNHERYIEQAIDGFLMQQTNFPFEAVIHDDASTDGTPAIIRKYEEKYPHIIKPVYEKENQYSKHDGSLSRIMNSRMTGKYIALCEGDDFWTNPQKLQKQYDALESHPECTIAFARVQFIQADGTVIKGMTAPHPKAPFGEIVTLKDYCEEEYGKVRWAFHTSCFFYRSSTLTINPELKCFPWGDMPRILNSLMIGNGCFINEITGCYRTMSGGYNSKVRSNTEFAIRERQRAIAALSQFDTLTNKQYHDAVHRRIRSEEYDMYIQQKQISKVLSSDYKGIIKPYRRMKDLIWITAPSFYDGIKKIVKG